MRFPLRDIEINFINPPLLLLQTDWLISFTVTAKCTFNYLFHLTLWELKLQVEHVIEENQWLLCNAVDSKFLY